MNICIEGWIYYDGSKYPTPVVIHQFKLFSLLNIKPVLAIKEFLFIYKTKHIGFQIWKNKMTSNVEPISFNNMDFYNIVNQWTFSIRIITYSKWVCSCLWRTPFSCQPLIACKKGILHISNKATNIARSIWRKTFTGKLVPPVKNMKLLRYRIMVNVNRNWSGRLY